tara:strand:+ start:1925 stop:3274 length:1350 start_codon:yes stop_codon:yes gene_type:complete
MKMKNGIDRKIIQSFYDEIKENEKAKLARNASLRNDLIELAMDWDHYRKIDHSFSNVVSGEMPATNQKSSGRCWGFAGLNLFRIYLGRKYQLKDFQFSQSYFMFWDKLEKSNFFLESIIKTTEEPWNSRLMMHLLKNPIQDGGQWDMWVNLVNKYGVVPQSEMPETFSSSKSMRMNRMITRKLREYARIIRLSKLDGASNNDLKLLKNSQLKEIFKMLTIHLGTPPNSFNWQTRNRKKEFIRFTDLTPNSFYQEHINLKLDDYICLIHCPMSDKKFDTVYTVKFLGNVIEGKPIRYLNVEIDVIKNATINSIKNDDPVWFGCDVGKYFHRDIGIMDMDLFDFDSFYGTKFSLDKAMRLEYGDSQMTHAMLFTGVDLDSQGSVKKWRVENSWGNKGGDKGYHIMSNKWFEEYNYEVVVHKSYLSRKFVKLYNESRAVPLEPWDPMGALAK